MRNEEIVRGEEAKRIIEHPIFKESVQKVRDGIISAMERSPMGDTHTHNKLCITLQLLKSLEKHLEDVITTGRMAEIQTSESLSQRIKKVAGF